MKPWERDWSQPTQPASGAKPWEMNWEAAPQEDLAGTLPTQEDIMRAVGPTDPVPTRREPPSALNVLGRSVARSMTPTMFHEDLGIQWGEGEDAFMRERVHPAIGSFNRGIAHLLALPGELLNQSPRLLNLLPGVEGQGPAFVPSVTDAIESGLRDIGAIPAADYQPIDKKQQILNRAAEEVGFTVAPTAGLIGRGQRMLSEGVKAGRSTMGRIADQFVAPFARSPAQATAVETGLAAAGGAGAGVAQIVAPDNTAAEVGGAVAGSVVAPTIAGGVRSVGRGVRTLLAPDRFADSVVRRDVGALLAKNTTLPGRAFEYNLADAMDYERAVPGLQYTTGQATNDPGLLALEYSRSKAGPNVGDFVIRESDNNQAVLRAIEDVAPEATTDTATRARLAQRQQDFDRRVAENVAGKEAAREEVLRETYPEMPSQEAGATIRGELDEALAARRAQQREKWQAIDPEGAVTIDTAPIQEEARNILGSMSRAQRELTGDEVPDILRRIAGEGEEAGFFQAQENIQEVLSARSIIQDQIRAERAAGAPNRTKIAQLERLNAALFDALESAPVAGEAFKEATAFSRQLNDDFTRGPVAQVTASDARGGPRTPDSGVAARFWTNKKAGAPEAIEAFTKAVGDRPAAVNALRAYAIEDALKQAGNDPVKLQRWIDQHKAALDAFPELRRELGNVRDAEAAVRRAQRRQEILAKKTRSPRESTIAKYLDKETAADSMQAILGSGHSRREMTNLMNTLKGDKDAVEGARRAFFDLMLDGPSKSPKQGVATGAREDLAGEPIIKSQAFEDFLTKHKDEAAILFRDSPEHLERLKDISAAVKRGQRTNQAKGPASSGTALASQYKDIPPMSLTQYTSRAFSVARGVVSKKFVLIETSARGARRALVRLKKEQFDELLDRALLDPEVAKTLVMEYNDSTANVIARRLRLHLGNEISALASDDDE